MDLAEYAHQNLKNIPKCDDYDLMMRGLPYNCMADTLVKARVLSHERALDYAGIRLKDYGFDTKAHANARYEYLSEIFGKCEPDIYLEPPFNVDYGCNIEIGKGFYANFNCTFLDCTIIKFGDQCLLGPNVTFTTATHPTDPVDRKNMVEYAFPITVGNNVWFGANSVILPGVTIGDDCVIAAGAVVNKDVPSRTVVAGVPARVIKEFPEERGTT